MMPFSARSWQISSLFKCVLFSFIYFLPYVKRAHDIQRIFGVELLTSRLVVAHYAVHLMTLRTVAVFLRVVEQRSRAARRSSLLVNYFEFCFKT